MTRFQSVASVLAALALLLALGVAGSRAVSDDRVEGPMRIVVGVPPLVELVRAIAPEGATVQSLVPPGQTVHGYEIRPSDVRALARADLIVFVGLGIDQSLEDYARGKVRPAQRVLGWAPSLGLKAADDHDHEGHVHGPDCNHGPVDPHLWLDPTLVVKFLPKVQAQIESWQRQQGASEQALSDTAERVQAVIARVEAMDAEYQRRLAPIKGSAIVTHHNAWSRLAERYGLKVAAVIRIAESSEPTPAAMADAVKAIREHGVRAVFFEPAYDPGMAKRIADAAGVSLGTLDPESQEDWFAMMQSNLESLATLLTPAKLDESR